MGVGCNLEDGSRENMGRPCDNDHHGRHYYHYYGEAL